MPRKRRKRAYQSEEEIAHEVFDDRRLVRLGIDRDGDPLDNMLQVRSGGASRKELEQVIRTAMKAWPATVPNSTDD